MSDWIRQWAANAIPTHGEHTISIGDFPRIPHGVFHIQSHELCPVSVDGKKHICSILAG